MAAALVQVPPPPPSLLHMPATSPTTAMNNNSNPPISSKQKSDTNTWEFTRRKRWPELLINELSEAIAFILSPTGKVLFCSPAVQELLGWRDEELIDADLADLVNEDDRQAFRNGLGDAVRSQTDMLVYTRLLCKSPGTLNALQASLGVGSLVPSSSSATTNTAGISDYGYSIPIAGPSTSVPARPPALPSSASIEGKEVLFELTAYPHFSAATNTHGGASQECKCLFAMAKPYPSRNATMLNTFLELKVENERLQQRLADLRATRPSGARPRVPLRPPPLQLPLNSSGRAGQQQQQQQQSPLSAHPGSYVAHTPGYTVPVSMPMPMSSLAAGQGYAPPPHTSGPATPAYYAHQHHHHQHHPHQQHASAGYGDYAVGLGLTPEAGYRYPDGMGRSEDPLGVLAMNGTAAVQTPIDGARRQSVSGPSGGEAGGAGAGAAGAAAGGEEESAKKKAKRRHVGEQFVCRTCGRTDSPEWRKGPQGPKTLCNACGLRWAKQVRKGGEDGE